MKILIILGSYYPAQTGGPNNSIYWLVSELSKDSNYNVTVVSTLFGIADDKAKEFNIVPDIEIDFKGMKTIYFTNNFKKNSHYSFKLYLWLIKNFHKYDIIHCTSFFSPYTILITILSRIYRKKFIISPRGEFDEGAIIFAKLKKECFIKIANKILCKHALFHATSEKEREITYRYFPEVKTYVLPNLMIIDEGINIDTKRSNILYLGRIHPKKGLENLLKAYSLLKGSIRKAHKVLIAGSGTGDYVLSLKKMAEDLNISKFVEFTGHVDGEEKVNLFLYSKIFVLPSHAENFGNVVIEAMNYGTYVVTSKNTPWEILNEKGIGSCIYNVPIRIKVEIEKVLGYNDEEYSSIVRKAKEFLVNEFNVKKKIDGYKNMYDDFLEV